MSSIKGLLGGAQSALNAQKSVLNLIGKNINNANMEGYSRQRLPLAAGPLGLAVTTGTAESIRSQSMQHSLLAAKNGLGFQEGMIHVLSLAEPAINDLNGSGLSFSMEGFFSSLADLAGDPSGVAERENLLSLAGSLVTAFHTTAEGLAQAQKAAGEDATLVANDINQITDKVASINKEVATLAAQGLPYGELSDQRDVLLGKLAEQIDIQTLEKANGNVQVFLTSGRKLVDGDKASAVVLAVGPGEPMALTVDTPSGTSLAVTGSVGGRLGGLMLARDVTLQAATSKLDELAYAFATEMNTVHQGGFGTDGSTGNLFFGELTSSKGAAGVISVSNDILGKPEKLAASGDITQLPGDDSNLQAMLGLQDAKVVGGKTLYEAYDGVVFTVATTLHDANGQLAVGEQRLASLKDLRASESGVSLDEEMLALSQAQRAFEASSRVIKTANELYDTLLRMV